MTAGLRAIVRPARWGMTLVELLVVAGLVGTLLALTVVGVRGGGSQRQKRTAEDLASLLASTQGRALGVPEGAAAILEPSGTGGGIYCTNGFDAEMLPLITGSVPVPSTEVWPNPKAAPPALPSTTVAVQPTNADDLNRVYRILLFRGVEEDETGSVPYQPPTAWFQFTPPGTISFRLGQTTSNAIWPRPPIKGGFDALLAQYPVKSSVAAEFDPTTAVDLRWSGVGDKRGEPYGRLDNLGAIAVVFDRVGRVAEIIQQVPKPGDAVPATAVQPLVPTSTIYFLIVPRLEVEDTTRNPLASRDALWVALAPQSGRVFVAENVPVLGQDDDALWDARAKARRGITVGK